MKCNTNRQRKYIKTIQFESLKKGKKKIPNRKLSEFDSYVISIIASW